MLKKQRQQMTVTVALVISMMNIPLISTIGRAADPDVNSYPSFNKICSNAEVQQYVKDLSEPKQSAYASLALSACGSEAVSALTPLLNKSDQEMRHTAISILTRMGNEAKVALPVLIDALKDPDLRPEAASAIGAIGPDAKAAIAALASSLREEKDSIPSSAAEALGQIGKATVPALITALQDPDPQVRSESAAALSHIGEDAADQAVAVRVRA